MELGKEVYVFWLLFALFSGRGVHGETVCANGFTSLERISNISQLRTRGVQQQRIIPDIKFTCNGTITKWIFLARWQNANRECFPDLQIWRRNGNNTYVKVGNTTVIIGNRSDDSIYEITLTDNPLEFEVGDILGIFQPDNMIDHLLLYYDDVGPVNYYTTVAEDQCFPVSGDFNINGAMTQFDTPLVTVEIGGGDLLQCAEGFATRERITTLSHYHRALRHQQQLIFPSINFTCDGTITKWIVGAGRNVNGNRTFYPDLQIWRETPESTYTRVGNTTFVVPNFSPNSVFEFSPDPPLPFQAGDVLGIFQPPDSKGRLRIFYDRDAGPISFSRSTGDDVVEAPLDSFTTTGANRPDDLPLITVEISVALATSAVAVSNSVSVTPTAAFTSEIQQSVSTGGPLSAIQPSVTTLLIEQSHTPSLRLGQTSSTQPQSSMPSSMAQQSTSLSSSRVLSTSQIQPVTSLIRPTASSPESALVQTQATAQTQVTAQEHPLPFTSQMQPVTSLIRATASSPESALGQISATPVQPQAATQDHPLPSTPQSAATPSPSLTEPGFSTPPEAVPGASESFPVAAVGGAVVGGAVFFVVLGTAIIVVAVVFVCKKKTKAYAVHHRSSSVEHELDNPLYGDTSGNPILPNEYMEYVEDSYSTVERENVYDSSKEAQHYEMVDTSSSPHQTTFDNPLYYIDTAPELELTFTNELYGQVNDWGIYVPTQEQRSSFTKSGGANFDESKIYESLHSTLSQGGLQGEWKFFEEKEIYWSPATNSTDLYAQLSKYRFREIQRQQTRMTGFLGSGQFGTVNKGVWFSPSSPVDVAIKQLKEGASEDDRVKFLQEAAITGQFHHQNVVQLHGVVTVGEPVMIILEFMPNGDLRSFLLKQQPSPGDMLPDSVSKMCLEFSHQTASGMEYLAKKSFVHRDLAARNILLTENKTCKIADFGMARDVGELENNYYISHGGKIPVKWTAPEALEFKKYSTASDVWSFGALMYEIWSLGHKPFEGHTNVQALHLVSEGYRLPPPPGCPRTVYELMIQCWHPESSQRPSFSQLVQSLSCSEEELLGWSEEDTRVHPQAAVMGAPLEAGKDLYPELQGAYLSFT